MKPLVEPVNADRFSMLRDYSQRMVIIKKLNELISLVNKLELD